MTLQIGMIGTGGFARKHADVLKEFDDVRIAAFCGTSQAKAEASALPWNAAAYDNVTAMLDAQKLDAVYICVPPMAHGELEHALIERGVPFFVEKPVGLDLNVPAAIRDRVEQSGLLTSVGYHFRYMDSTQRAADALKSRKVGMAGGYWMGSMPGVSWWRNREGSGGQLIEQTTHIVDLIRYLLGEVDEVYAVEAGRVMHEKAEGVTVPDVGAVTLKLVSGVIVTVSNTCMLPESFRIGLTIYTDQGVLELTSSGLKDNQRGMSAEYRNSGTHYRLENEAFLYALKTGDRSRILSSYSDAWRTQQVTVAASQSAQTGRPVKIG